MTRENLIDKQNLSEKEEEKKKNTMMTQENLIDNQILSEKMNNTIAHLTAPSPVYL